MKCCIVKRYRQSKSSSDVCLERNEDLLTQLPDVPSPALKTPKALERRLENQRRRFWRRRTWRRIGQVQA